MYDTILFDLDGVLVDMPNGHFEALNRALSLFGTSIHPDEHIELFNGLPTRKKIGMLEDQQRIPKGLCELINDIKQQYTKELIPQFCPPEYSKIIMLQQLKRSGYKLGCCSNSIKETLHLMLESAGLKDFFDFIIGNDEVQNPKPAPDMYVEAMKRLDSKPDKTIIVEDAPHGIISAKASGATVYEVRGVEDVHIGLFADII